jgi:peptide/nickel transport system ATP-binding protein
MYAGRIVEKAPTRASSPTCRCPTPRRCCEPSPSSATAHTRLNAIGGRPPDLVNPPKGCAFAPRCPYAQRALHDREPDPAGGPRATPATTYACFYPVGSPETLEIKDTPGRYEDDAATPPPGAPAVDPAVSSTPPPFSGPAPATPPTFPGPSQGRQLMAGTGKAHLRASTRRPAAGREPGRRVPRGRTRPQGLRGRQRVLRRAQGETLGLVGESGCGKSTTGKAVMQLPRPTSWVGACSTAPSSPPSREPSCARSGTRMQMIFQDPISSLNPRRKVSQIVGSRSRSGRPATPPERPPRSTTCPDRGRHRPCSRGRAPAPPVLRRPVPAHLDRPRSCITDPSADHLRRTRLRSRRVGAGPDPQPARGHEGQYGLTLVFIAHDLAVVKNISDRMAVMYLGKMCEVGPPDVLYDPGTPVHRRPGQRRSRCPTRRSTPAHSRTWAGSSPLRSILRRGAASAPAAPGPRSCARRPSRRCRRSPRVTTWRATSRSRRRSPNRACTDL